jgi:hypothetical protein
MEHAAAAPEPGDIIPALPGQAGNDRLLSEPMGHAAQKVRLAMAGTRGIQQHHTVLRLQRTELIQSAVVDGHARLFARLMPRLAHIQGKGLEMSQR